MRLDDLTYKYEEWSTKKPLNPKKEFKDEGFDMEFELELNNHRFAIRKKYDESFANMFFSLKAGRHIYEFMKDLYEGKQ